MHPLWMFYWLMVDWRDVQYDGTRALQRSYCPWARPLGSCGGCGTVMCGLCAIISWVESVQLLHRCTGTVFIERLSKLGNKWRFLLVTAPPYTVS